jgi:hypothetical protein
MTGVRSEGPVAQRLEQGTHNPLVGGSNPSGPTIAWSGCGLTAAWRQGDQAYFSRTALVAFGQDQRLMAQH